MTAFVYGICGDAVYASARTNDVSLHLGQVLKQAFLPIGTAGGHARMAGATILLRAFGRVSKRALKAEIDRKVGRRFLEVIGVVEPRARRKRAKH